MFVSNRRSEWDNYLRTELEKLVNLPTGWDGYNSPSVSFTNAECANDLLSKMKQRLENSRPDIQALVPTAPYLVPVAGGALQVEWHLNDDSVIELFFDQPDDIEISAYKRDGSWEQDFVMKLDGAQTSIGPLIECFRAIKES